MSLPFLVLSVLIYIFFEKSQNLHRRLLMCYMFCLSLLYIILGVSQMEKEIIKDQFLLCSTLSYLTYYAILVCFMWLLIMSLNVLQSLKYLQMSPEQSHDNIVRLAIKKEQKVNFMKYALLSFGIPSLITIALIIFDVVIGSDDRQCSKLMVKFGDINFFFVFLPILVLIACGLFVYIRTGFEIFNMRKGLSKVGISNMIRANHKLLSSIEDIEVDNARLKLETAR